MSDTTTTSFTAPGDTNLSDATGGMWKGITPKQKAYDIRREQSTNRPKLIAAQIRTNQSHLRHYYVSASNRSTLSLFLTVASDMSVDRRLRDMPFQTTGSWTVICGRCLNRYAATRKRESLVVNHGGRHLCSAFVTPTFTKATLFCIIIFIHQYMVDVENNTTKT